MRDEDFERTLKALEDGLHGPLEVGVLLEGEATRRQRAPAFMRLLRALHQAGATRQATEAIARLHEVIGAQSPMRHALLSAAPPGGRLGADLRDLLSGKWALIPAGEFMMGSPPDEPGRRDDEGPQHRVRITRPFLMKRTPITQAEWERLMGNNPSLYQGGRHGDTGSLPVDKISWFDALACCNAISQKQDIERLYDLSNATGTPGEFDSLAERARRVRSGDFIVPGPIHMDSTRGGYRLPTEAEWEHACRAGTSTAFFTGPVTPKDDDSDNEPNLDNVAWYKGSKWIMNPLTPCYPVGFLDPNPWGLYDMLGNISEHCWDWYRKDYYSYSRHTDPCGPITPDLGERSPSIPLKISRGGSAQCSYKKNRSSSRGIIATRQNSKASFNGLRPVRTST